VADAARIIALIAAGLLLNEAPLRADECAIFLAAAKAQIGKTLLYDPQYTALAYPGGDVPIERGVCSDVIIRAFRSVGLDLQSAVHEDMQRAWSAYPKQWGLRKPDPNIDHRRVPNLMTFFQRRGKWLAVTNTPEDYRPGDLVTCTVPPNLPHIMIVSDEVSSIDPARRLIIHNIGQGTCAEDRLFEFAITGHYRWW
jgi:uncharacterized protein YijF (DUF1287 family)